jgi:hypothetical protein
MIGGVGVGRVGGVGVGRIDGKDGLGSASFGVATGTVGDCSPSGLGEGSTAAAGVAKAADATAAAAKARRMPAEDECMAFAREKGCTALRFIV